MKNPVGRPKTLDRQELIDIACDNYWIYGINNVSLTTIAKLANVSRPGIYKEFGDEDSLKAEVLKKYTNILMEYVVPQYNSACHINTLYGHFRATIGFPHNTNIFKGIRSNNIPLNIPNDTKGCLFEKTKLEKHLLNKKSLRVLESYENNRRKIFLIFIKNMQKLGQINTSLTLNEIYDFIAAQLSIAELLQLNGMKKEKIINIINKALTSIINPKYAIH